MRHFFSKIWVEVWLVPVVTGAVLLVFWWSELGVLVKRINSNEVQEPCVAVACPVDAVCFDLPVN